MKQGIKIIAIAVINFWLWLSPKHMLGVLGKGGIGFALALVFYEKAMIAFSVSRIASDVLWQYSC